LNESLREESLGVETGDGEAIRGFMLTGFSEGMAWSEWDRLTVFILKLPRSTSADGSLGSGGAVG